VGELWSYLWKNTPIEMYRYGLEHVEYLKKRLIKERVPSKKVVAC
jgi:hypothetical protein